MHCPPGYAPRRILTKEGGQKVECIKVASRRNHRRRLYTGGRRRPKVGPPVLGARWGGESLSHTFYQDSCPKLESIVQTKIVEWIEKDITLAASLLRLHSQDCLVTVPIIRYMHSLQSSLSIHNFFSIMPHKSNKFPMYNQLLTSLVPQLGLRCFHPLERSNQPIH